MRRFAVLVTLTACNLGPPAPPPSPAAAVVHAPPPALHVDPWANPTPPPPSPLTHDDAPGLPYIELPNAPAPAAPPPPPTFGPAPRPPAPQAIVAPPSQAMRALAVMPDGSAAASVDVEGSVRLWPTLDGTREPVVVQMRRPVTLAMMRAGSGVALAGIDGAGQLELVVMGTLGDTPVRRSIELARPAIALHATTRGFIVERDDQRLVFLGANGQLLGDLEPPPGTHVAAIAVHDDHVLAILAGGGAVHGRWLQIDGGRMQWGPETGALPIAPRMIALAPDHKSIAAVEQTETSTRLVVIGLEHGDELAVGADNEFIDPTMEPVGFVDATTVLVRFQGFTSLWNTEGGMAELNEDRRAPVVAVGGGKVVSGSGAELMLADAAGSVRHLGFRIGTMNMFAPGARTLLATDGQHLVRLGSDLRDHVSFDLPEPQEGGYNVMALLDPNHVLVQSYRSEMYFDVIALDSMERSELPAYERFAAYDPPTHIAAFATNDKVLFRRFDGKTGGFGDAAELDTASASSVTFVDDHAIVMIYGDDGQTYTEQTVAQIRPEAHTLKLARTAKRRLQFSGGDEGGGFIPPSSPAVFTRTAKSPDGKLVATLTAGRLSLRDADGTTRWTVRAPGAIDVMWLGSGELLATGAGLARVDLETGAYSERRCGWQFGLWTDRIDNFASAQMCEAE